MITSFQSIIISDDQNLHHLLSPICCISTVYYQLQKQSYWLRYISIHLGIVNLISASSIQNTFSYNYQQSFQSIPQIAIGICSFSTPLHASNHDNTFYVLTIPSKTKLQVRARTIKFGWSVSRITFMASSNPELLLDIVSSRMNSLI